MVDSKIDFCFLNKSEKDLWLPELFELLYENMQLIAPSGADYEHEKQEWLAAVSPALEKEPRKIVLCFSKGELAGFLQFYTRQNMLMVEELQLKKKYHRTTAFWLLCRHMKSILPDDLENIEAYADKRNLKSIRLMQRLGMALCEEEQESPFVHLRGSMEKIRESFGG